MTRSSNTNINESELQLLEREVFKNLLNGSTKFSVTILGRATGCFYYQLEPYTKTTVTEINRTHFASADEDSLVQLYYRELRLAVTIIPVPAGTEVDTSHPKVEKFTKLIDDIEIFGGIGLLVFFQMKAEGDPAEGGTVLMIGIENEDVAIPIATYVELNHFFERQRSKVAA